MANDSNGCGVSSRGDETALKFTMVVAVRHSTPLKSAF